MGHEFAHSDAWASGDIARYVAGDRLTGATGPAMQTGKSIYAWLEQAFAERDPNMPFIGVNPIFDPLRAEPRFQALLKAMGLPQ
jgi:hypothetical protein